MPRPAAGARVDGSGRRPTVASRHAGRAFALLATVQFTLILTIGVLTLALPTLQRDLGLTHADLALVTTAYGLAFSGLLLLGGRLVDLFGRRRMFSLGTALFGGASAGAALAPGIGVLLAARFGQGVAAALTAPAAMALIGTVFPDTTRRTRAIAVWGGISSAGATVGTLLGGVLATVAWRWAFAVPAAVAGLAVLATRRLLPPGPPLARTRLDVPGAVLGTAGVSALSYGLVATLDQPWSATRVIGPLVAGAALLACFVAVESRTRVPLMPLSFLASARRATGLLGVLLGAAGAATIGFFLSLYLQQVRGWSPLEASAAFLPYFLILVTSLLGGRLIARIGVRPVTVTGLVVAAAGLLSLGRMDVDTAYAGVLLAGLVMFTVGAGLTFPGATVAAVDQSPDHQAGLAGGVMNTAMETGPTIGLALLVSLAGAHTTRLAQAGLDPPAAATGGYAFALSAAGAVFALAAALAAITLRTPAAPKHSTSRKPITTPKEKLL